MIFVLLINMKNRLQNYIDILLRGDEESSMLAIGSLKEDKELIEAMKQKELPTIYSAFLDALNQYNYNDRLLFRVIQETTIGRYLTIFLQTLNEQN